MSETIEVGQVWTDSIGQFRVMAVAEGYAMCRREGAMPFAESVKDILRMCSPVSVLKRQKGRK